MAVLLNLDMVMCNLKQSVDAASPSTSINLPFDQSPNLDFDPLSTAQWCAVHIYIIGLYANLVGIQTNW